MIKNLTYLILFSMLIFSCSSSGKDQAKALCDCLKDAGLKKGMNINRFPREIDEDNSCFTEFSKEIYDLMKPMNQDQRGEFMKNFSRALLDTECADIVFESLPYDDMLKGMERTMERKNRRERKSEKFSFEADVSVCDCVKMHDNLRNELEKVVEDEVKMREVEAKYEKLREECRQIGEGLSVEEMKVLEEEAKNCM